MTPMTEIASFPVDAARAVEVHLDEAGNAWVGMTTHNEPEPCNDWTFAPREQYGAGEAGRSMAVAAAEAWARGMAYDATRAGAGR